jgi:hypothetical protein
MTFKEAVEKTPQLKNAYQVGLQALRAEDKPHIEAEDTRRLTGSVDVDTAYQKIDPQANRWDFGIAYQHTNRKAEVVYWVETHTASDAEVKVVIKKALWLLAWLKGDGALLDRSDFERDIVWVSSGATTFTLTSPQKKQMAQAGLLHAGGRLRIRNERKS